MANYRPGLPQKNDNVSHESPAKEFGTLLIGLLLLLSLTYWVIGLLVDFSVNRLSYENEAVLFEKIPVQWTDVIGGDVEPASARLQSLVEDLRQCSKLPTQIKVSVLNDDSPNAVALPGYHMLVFKGLFEHIQSENGLAFVLAHELGHFINRDHLRGMGRGIVLVALSAALTGPNSSISRLLTPSVQLNTARFSQGRESAADLSALEILDCYYGHTNGAAEFFKSLETIGPKNNVNHYFASHPDLNVRIKRINTWRVENNPKLGDVIEWVR